jgi:hypothetical protein
MHYVNSNSGDARSAKTDSQGGYNLAGVPADSFVVAYAGDSGYEQPCAATLTLRGDDVINLDLVNMASCSRSSVGRSTGAVSPTLSGVVFETTAEGRLPIADAHVFFSGYGASGVTRIWPVNTTDDDAVLDIELKRTD